LDHECSHDAAAFLSVVLVVDAEMIGLEEFEFAAPMDVEPILFRL
jgi:hypothetical protein